MRIFRSDSSGSNGSAIVAGVAILAAALTGCNGTRGGPVPYGVQNFGAPDAPKASDFAQEYRIGPRDVLTVQVFQVPSLSAETEVDAQGNIAMPLLGAVAVQGKTNTEVANEIETRLGAKYLQNPQVQVVVKEAQSQRVTIDGSVTNPGVFPIAGQTTLLQALALAHGAKDDANLRRVVVFRTIDGQRMAAAFDAKDIQRGLSTDPTIYGNDIIIVDGNAWRGRFRDFISSVPLLAMFRPF